ncbi:OLC1v1009639C1 [Oldenlandia corymbosa var. corymbosa]|uniref:OLC1v1009639C1 n=1 Tax=Oldenlandia corymbosa var. corymbosa TaxID=529605 RepID=A0AAV1DQY9_OLDCO|nr:OLC1v1009639C1 [Oldenlandia corymbosa var. corymbosa]
MGGRFQWFWLLIMHFTVIIVCKISFHFWWVPIIVDIAAIFVCKKVWFQFWYIPRRIEHHFFVQGIKGPKYSFLLGNLKEIGNLTSKASSQPMPLSTTSFQEFFPSYDHWRKIHGSTLLLWFGLTARVTEADPTLLKDIFITKSEYFEKIDSPFLLKKLEGDGLLNLKGIKWAHHRKVISPAFYLENLKLMVPLIGVSMEKMLKQWLKLMSSSEDDGSKVEIDVSEWFQNIAEEVMARAAFGISYEEEGRAIYKLQAQQMAYAAKAFEKIFTPGYRFLPTETNRNCWRLEKEIRESITKLIDKRRNTKYSSPIKMYSPVSSRPNDLLDFMISGFNKENAGITNPPLPPPPL